MESNHREVSVVVLCWWRSVDERANCIHSTRDFSRLYPSLVSRQHYVAVCKAAWATDCRSIQVWEEPNWIKSSPRFQNSHFPFSLFLPPIELISCAPQLTNPLACKNKWRCIVDRDVEEGKSAIYTVVTFNIQGVLWFPSIPVCGFYLE